MSTAIGDLGDLVALPLDDDLGLADVADGLDRARHDVRAEPVGRRARSRRRRCGRASCRACRSRCARAPRRTPARPRGGSRAPSPPRACWSPSSARIVKTWSGIRCAQSASDVVSCPGPALGVVAGAGGQRQEQGDGDDPSSHAGSLPRHDVRVPAQVIVLAGPSGSGKSHLAERLEAPDPAPRRLLPRRLGPRAAADHVRRERRPGRLGRSGLLALRRGGRGAHHPVPHRHASRRRSTTSRANGRNGTQTLSLCRCHPGRGRGDLRPPRGRPAPRGRAARRGVLPAPAPDGHVLAPPLPRPPRAPQAAARPGASRDRPHARPAPHRRGSRRRRLHGRLRRRGLSPWSSSSRCRGDTP